MMGTDLSSLRILSISVRSLSVSRCKVAKWCSCTTQHKLLNYWHTLFTLRSS
jgi:hypothetical protein